MDIELRLPLLRWSAEQAALPDLRRAAALLTEREARAATHTAVEQAMRVALPPPTTTTTAASPLGASQLADGPSAAAAAAPSGESAAAESPLSLGARPHVARFVDEQVSTLMQLADYLLTEQLSECTDRLATMRAHLRALIQRADHEQLQILFDKFCSKDAKRAAHAAAQPTSHTQPVTQSAPQSTVSKLQPAAEPSVLSARCPAPAMPPVAAAAASSVSPIAASPVPSVSAVSPTTAASSPAASSSSSSAAAASSSAAAAPVVVPSFLQSSVGSHMDLLCLLLSYTGCWDLLRSGSRVCRRWFAASLDPRCFRQIRQVRITHFMQPETAPPASNEWAWNAAPTAPAWPAPLPVHYESLTRMLLKLGNLSRLELGPRSPDALLRAIGEGVAVTARAPSDESKPSHAHSFLPELRALLLPGCATLTDEGIRALVQHCATPTATGATAGGSAVSPLASSTASPACFLHRVVQLDLSGCRLLTDRGFSLLFAHTPALRHVDLSYCNGAGVATLQALAKLCPRVTRLSLTGARGVTDDGLRALAGGGLGSAGTGGGLASLRHLSIEDCWNVTSTGLLHLSNGCRELCSLNASGTYNGVNESALGSLVARGGLPLTDLNFTGCPLTDSGVAVLMHGVEGGSGGLRGLRSLKVSMMGRMGPSAAELSNAGVGYIASSVSAITLTTLDLTACALVTDSAVALLASRCVALLHLSLSRCAALSDVSVAAMGSGVFASTLLSLDLSHVYQLTDGCLPAIQRCIALQDLNLRKCLRISDQAWGLLHPRSAACEGDGSAAASSMSPVVSASSISSSPRLLHLDLSGCKLSDHGLRRLSLSWRRALHLQASSSAASDMMSGDPLGSSSSAHSSSAAALPPRSSVALLPSLLSLCLNECHALTDAGLNCLLPLLPSLEALEVVGLFHLTNQPLLESVARCTPRLRVIRLHQCVEISDAGVSGMVSSLKGLREVGLDELPLVTDASVLSLALHCPELERLSIARSTAVTFRSLLQLVQACPQLIHLNCALATQLTALATTHPDPMWQQLLRICARRGIEFLR